MAHTLCGVSHASAFNAMHDITWSFNYCLSGNTGTTGVFSTFLYEAPSLKFTALSAVSGDFFSISFNSIYNSLTANGSSMTLPFAVKTDTEKYKTLRFQLTDVGQTLNVFYREPNKTTTYQLITSLSVGSAILSSKPLRVGVSYRSPITGDKARFRIKDLHVQGLKV